MVKTLIRSIYRVINLPKSSREEIKLIKKSGLFDSQYYLEQNPDVYRNGLDPVVHYWQIGGYEGRNPNKSFDSKFYLENNPEVSKLGINPFVHWLKYGKNKGFYTNRIEDETFLLTKSSLFNKKFYLEENPDIAKSKTNALEHYLLHGWKEARNPGKDFDTKFYLLKNPDVAKLDINPLIHYLRYGHKEGRFKNENEIINAKIKQLNLFDEKFYLKKYSDVAKSKKNPFEHFMQYGWKEGRSPCKQFDLKYYLKKSPDVAKSNINPLVHYIKSGINEGRFIHPIQSEIDDIKISGYFDEKYYFEIYPDLEKGKIDPIKHYCEQGWKEGRSPSTKFDTRYYLEYSGDIFKAQVNPLYHYINDGKKQGRIPYSDYGHCLHHANITELINEDFEFSFKGKIAVVLHIFYEEFIPEVITKLKNIPDNFDIYISTKEEIKSSVIKQFNYHFGKKKVKIKVFDNRGRDIAPFLLGFGKSLLKYDLVCKIHSKKSQHKYELKNWQNHLVYNLLGSKKIVRSILFNFENDSKLGVIYPVVSEFLDKKIKKMSCWGNNYKKSAKLRKKLKIKSRSNDIYDFPVGSMFWFRPMAIKPLLDLNLEIDDFDLEKGQIDGTLAHVIERLFGLILPKQELTIKSVFFEHELLTLNPVSNDLIETAQQNLINSKIAFSIVMPTWNRKNLISKAIDSVLAQSFQNFELIISDDGSDDGTEKYILRKYKHEIKTKKIRFISNKHKGVSAARNKALKHAQYEWIAYLDSDNIWRKNYLLLTAYYFAQNPNKKTSYAQLRLYDTVTNRYKLLKDNFDLKELKNRNFIDLNIYAHKKTIYNKLGGFDKKLKRLVDWDLIIRYSEKYKPINIPYVLCDYYLSKSQFNISYTVSLDPNLNKVREKIQKKVIKRIAYILPDFPAKSQTFVFAEIKSMIEKGYDIKVFYSITADEKASLDFTVESYKIDSPEHLSEYLKKHKIDWCHCHFAYPTVTEYMYPASKITGIPYSFMPHAVDIFAYVNMKRNRIKEITEYQNCMGVIVYGDFHEKFLIEQGVPVNKIIKSAQSINIPKIKQVSERYYTTPRKSKLKIVSIARFIEKKGLIYLLEAAKEFSADEIQIKIYGYGPDQEKLKNYIKENNIDNVTILPPYSTLQEQDRIYANADLFALPCIRAKNGDMDGMPTVFFDAIAAGVPVLTTNTSGISDFLSHNSTAYIVPQKDTTALVECLKDIYNSPRYILANLAKNAQKNVLSKVGTNVTVNTLTCLMKSSLDVVCVVAPGGNLDNTYKLIDDLIKYTSTPFKLTIVNNACDDVISQKLDKYVAAFHNVEVLKIKKLVGLGIALNRAYKSLKGDFIIYICCNEGVVTKRGWERPIINYMVNNNDIAMAGTIISSPKWLKCKDYLKQPWFKDFRNQEFAKNNPDKVLRHVQGGIYVLRRDVFKKHGGYKLSHNHMDVEYSYYLESLGYKLGNIPEIVSLTVLTLPKITAHFHEKISAVHPVITSKERQLIKDCVSKNWNYCNITSTLSKISNRAAIDVSGSTLNSGSTGFSRMIYRYLGLSEFIYAGLSAKAIMPDHSLKDSFSKFFNLIDYKVNNKALSVVKIVHKLEECKNIDFLVLNKISNEAIISSEFKKQFKKVKSSLKCMIFSIDVNSDGTIISPSELSKIAQFLGFKQFEINYASEILDIGLNNIFVWKKQ